MSVSVSQKRARTRVALILAVGVVTAGLVVLGYEFHVLRSYELKTVDARFAVRGSTGTPKDVVNVLIDDVTFSNLRLTGKQVRWPYPRRLHARVINRIEAAHPRALAVDIQFTEPTDGIDDNALIHAAQNAHHPVFSSTEFTKTGLANIFGGYYRHIGVIAGNTNVQEDVDGVLRRMPYKLDNVTGFGVAAAERYLGHPVKAPPTDEPYIDFAGPPGTIKSYSFSDVYYGKVPPSAFRDKLVVVGPSAPSLQDVHATSASGSAPMPGAEIQANAAETAIRGFPLRDVPRGIDIALIVVFAFIAPLATLRFSGWWPGGVAVVAALLLAVAAQLAFDHGKVFAFTYPIAALAISTAAALIIQYVLEAFERALTRDVFSRFVPDTVVERVLARTDEHLRLGGERVTGTVMFTDLRGFTTFSELLPAEQVIGLLNRYLSAMSEAILAHEGTIVSYIGDGIMAVFGAPLPQEDHADRAVATAIDMLENRLPAFNEWMREQGFERGFKMGIGLNTGPFMSGNVGSERRLEYTAIGDTINTASRLEGMTKGTPYALFIADETREALTDEVADMIYIDELPVRGRKEPIKIWSLERAAVMKADWQAEVAKASEPAPDSAPAAQPV